MPASVDLDDLIQAGMIGLMDAASRYKEDQGAQFETYASQRIRGAMLDELRANDWLPRSMRKASREVESAVHKVEQNLGRAASETEIAKHMNMPLDEYQSMLQDLHGSQLIYYEDFDRSADDEPFLDRYCVDRSDPLSALLDDSLRSALIDAIDKLPEGEKLLMSLYYERDLNLREIGAVMEVSESRVCQLHSQAVARLRSKLREQSWTSRRRLRILVRPRAGKRSCLARFEVARFGEYGLAFAKAFCAIHRAVGGAQQGGHVGPARGRGAGKQARADARRYRDRPFLHRRDRAQDRVDAVGYRQHRAAVADLMREHDELVAAETREGVRRACVARAVARRIAAACLPTA
ncbi:RNA polymerase sigma factor for flagellar operon [Candidatus Paraburkholderia kirkii]|nr:RNA polymerase sigma factor for flagellar operon [Candidatus Paraburkholderia kirkii]